IIKSLIKEGYRPIIFCRFIATAEYVAEQLRERLPKKVTTIAVTSKLGPEDREARVNELADTESCVLVCTDCLSEGINLQHLFDAVIHYDLSWNPTRHEQREGRVDRFGQPSPEVKVLTYYGTDNYIDGAVLDVLIEKHQRIRRATGISIPIPKSKGDVMKAVLNAIIRRDRNSPQSRFDFMDEEVKESSDEIDREWQNVAEREKKSRSLFAQHSIKADEVAAEVEEISNAIGTSTDVKNFVLTMIRRNGGTAQEKNGAVNFDISETRHAIREVVDYDDKFTARFEPNTRHNELYLPRTHRIVDGLATYTMDTALDSEFDTAGPVIAARCGVIRTSAVTKRTTLLLVRFRYHIVTTSGTETQPLLAEDCQLVGFEGAPEKPNWLALEQAEELFNAKPDENVTDDVASGFIERVIGRPDDPESQSSYKQFLQPHLSAMAEARGKELLHSHQRVRKAAKRKNVKHSIEPQTPPDVLGVFVYLPVIS
ncbi:helicase-related protein, partial [Mariniblastus sp.]|nr:helicase-related protein [Mariniblastus sp.]